MLPFGKFDDQLIFLGLGNQELSVDHEGYTLDKDTFP
jgi:hypothetical protein